MPARDENLRGVIQVRRADGAGCLGAPRGPVRDHDRVTVLGWEASRIPRGRSNPCEAVAEALDDNPRGGTGLGLCEAGGSPDAVQEEANAVNWQRSVGGGSGLGRKLRRGVQPGRVRAEEPDEVCRGVDARKR